MTCCTASSTSVRHRGRARHGAGRLPGDGDPSLDVLPLEAAAGPPRPEILAQSPCRNVPLPKIEREEMRVLTPAEIVDLAEAIHAATGRWYSWVPTGAADRGWPDSAQAGSICRPGAVTLAEIPTAVKG